jgi:hypothetical protein
MKTTKKVAIVIEGSNRARMTIPAREALAGLACARKSGRNHELSATESQVQIVLPAGFRAAYVDDGLIGGTAGVYSRVVRLPDEPEFPGETGAVLTA